MDISGLLKSLNAQRVRYVVIVDAALPTHGHVGTSLTIDVFARPVPENAKRILNAFALFGREVAALTADDLLHKKILIRQDSLLLNLHSSVRGNTFEAVWRNRVKDEIEGIPVFVASLDDLIKMKRAANRSKDREDLKVLRALKKKLEARSRAKTSSGKRK